MPFFAKAQLSSAARFTYYADVFEESPHQIIATEESPFRYPFHLSWEIVTSTAIWAKFWIVEGLSNKLKSLKHCSSIDCDSEQWKMKQKVHKPCLRIFFDQAKTVHSIPDSNQLPELLEVTSLNKKLFLYFVFFFVVVASSFETLSFRVLWLKPKSQKIVYSGALISLQSRLKCWWASENEARWNWFNGYWHKAF